MNLDGMGPTMPLHPRSDHLRAKAKELEAAFLAEMLGHTGLNSGPTGFDGGAGEEQFASFLRDEQAKLMVDRGGIGLAEVLFQALAKAQGGKTDG